MPASARGAVRDARTPTAENGIVPATRRQRQPPSQTAPSGTASCRQTMDSSSAVRVIEKKSPALTQAGIGVLAASLQTAKAPSITIRVSLGKAIGNLMG